MPFNNTNGSVTQKLFLRMKFATADKESGNDKCDS